MSKAIKTFIEKYAEVKGHRKNERFILQNLTTTKGAKLRKTRFGWTIKHSHGTKWLAEFSDESDILYFDEDINGKGLVDFPRFLYFYKESGECIKEVVLDDIFKGSYHTHKILTKEV